MIVWFGPFWLQWDRKSLTKIFLINIVSISPFICPVLIKYVWHKCEMGNWNPKGIISNAFYSKNVIRTSPLIKILSPYEMKIVRYPLSQSQRKITCFNSQSIFEGHGKWQMTIDIDKNIAKHICQFAFSIIITAHQT